WPSHDVRLAIEAQAAAWQWPDAARRTRTERLHVTLHFLGERPTDELPALRKALDVAWEGCELLLDRAGVWPGGIAVLEASTVPPALARLHAALRERLAALGVPVEARPWRPHVTLARKASGAKPPPAAPPLRWSVPASHALVRSLPGGRGYETLQCFG
ncbi:MAG TPA: RNA 2',3'-cyclic phosphodiesterase, partial [Ramlibacter sp.]|nr:RNA 2',3'-cyclic phosphodiesterase [Ramlibacter sp.]